MATTDVISLDTAMSAISMTGPGAKHGEMVSLFVSAISEVMDNLCGPIVVREVTEDVYANGGMARLSYWPVVSITSVTEYVAGEATVLTAETNTVAGDYLNLNGYLSRRSDFIDINWHGNARVVYQAGRFASTAAVSARFQLAAAQIIARMWPQYAASWSRGGVDFTADEGGVGFFRSIEPVAAEILQGDIARSFAG